MGTSYGKMAMSGVQLDNDCKVKYDEIQKQHMHRFVTFNIRDDKEVCVDMVGARDATFDDFCKAVIQLDASGSLDCRYAILDYEFDLVAPGTKDSQRDIILLFMYCPESAKINKQMMYRSSFDTVKRAFSGIKKTLNINDVEDLDEEFVKQKAMEGLQV